MATVLGTNTSGDALNTKLCALAQDLANVAYESIKFAAYVDGQGQSGLQAAGMDTAGATAFQAATDYLKTVAQVFLGQVAQTPAFNFSSALANYIGPDPQG